MLAMPWTIVRKMIGVITIFTRLMKVSPSGLRAFPTSGATTPTTTPQVTATSTCTVRLRARRDSRVIGRPVR